LNHGTPFTSRIYRKGRKSRHVSSRVRFTIVLLLSIGLAYSWLFLVQAHIVSFSSPTFAASKALDSPGQIEDKPLLQKMFFWFTGVDVDQPRSLLAGQIPSLTGWMEQEAELAYDDGLGRYMDPPMESNPPLEWILNENETPNAVGENGQTLGWTEVNADTNVFIYHTHNRESYLPWLDGVKDPNRAYDENNNITIAGRKLGDELEARGVGAVVSTKDYAKVIPSYAKSYAYSLKTLKNTLNQHSNIQYVFDLHRDSQPRKKTTVMINGKTYAQIYIIIGKRNPNWNKNYELGVRFHKKVEELFPGLSKSVYTKKLGNGDYNQSAFPNSVLIEVGGVGNTKQEVFRTVEAMAEVIAELVQESNPGSPTVVQHSEEEGKE
jgi:stage II sporulation protein P